MAALRSARADPVRLHESVSRRRLDEIVDATGDAPAGGYDSLIDGAAGATAMPGRRRRDGCHRTRVRIDTTVHRCRGSGAVACAPVSAAAAGGYTVSERGLNCTIRGVSDVSWSTRVKSVLRASLRRLPPRLRESLRSLVPAGPTVRVDPRRAAGGNSPQEGRRFSPAWYRDLYQALGDGIRCYRPQDAPAYGGGCLASCACCPPGARLNLLPGEEVMFADVINDTDFRLQDHPLLEDRKTIVCSKLGHCGGRKPFICRTHPVYYVNGLMLFEESLCRLKASTYITTHETSVENIRAIVYRFGIENTTLGYGRNIRVRGEDVHSDYEH